MNFTFQTIPNRLTGKLKSIGLIVLMISFLPQTQAQNEEVVWLTNLEEAQIQAKKQGKLILLNFSGSDWCGNCKRLHKTLFESAEFQTYSTKNLILLNLDFPAKKKNRLSKEQSEYNDKLAEKYNKKGVFPQVFVLDSDGKVVGNLEYPQKDPQTYINTLKNFKPNE